MRLSRLVVRLRVPIVIGWIVAAVCGAILLPAAPPPGSAPIGGLVARDAEALLAEQADAERFGYPLLARTLLVQRAPDGLTDAAVARAIDRAAGAAAGRDPDVVAALPVANHLPLGWAGERGTGVLTYLAFRPGQTLEQERLAAQRYVADTGPADHVVGTTGISPVGLSEWNAIHDALPYVEVATVALIALVLAFSFRALGPPLITLAAAAIAYVLSVRLATALGNAVDKPVPTEAEPVVVVLLLGLVTDYAVFVLASARRELGGGTRTKDAVATGLRRVGPTVAAAGIIVGLGGISLTLGGLDFFRALGPALAIAVVVGLLVSLTFVPAATALLGRATFWPSLGGPSILSDERVGGGRISTRLAELASRRWSAAALAGIAVVGLVALALGLLGARLGLPSAAGLPDGSAPKRAAAAASQAFAPGVVAPSLVTLEGTGLNRQGPALERLEALLARQPGVAGVVGPVDGVPAPDSSPFVTPDGTGARLVVVLASAPLGAEALGRIRALDRELPRLVGEAGLVDARPAIAGDTALAAETIDGLVDDLKLIIGVALLVNVLLLAVFLRSVVAPLYLAGASLLALAASLGLTKLVFDDLLGHDGVAYYVPFATAVLLLSLGCDYNLFVVGRIWDRARGAPLGEAIADAVPRASHAIAVAGGALAASFGLLAIVPLDAFRQLAFAMGVGILVDTFLVRTLLVPSLVRLVGEASWWPGGRRRLRAALDDPQAPPPRRRALRRRAREVAS